MADDIIIHCQPVVSEADDIGLTITYACLDCSVKEWLTTWKWMERKVIVGPMYHELAFYIQDYEAGAGPIFIQDIITFKPFAIIGADNSTFHCTDCGRIIVEWFAGKQMEWAQKYHGDWYKSISAGSPHSKRLN